MKTAWIAKLTLLPAVALLAGAAQGSPFEPLFRVMKINGECMVKKPAAAVFAPALVGRTYPYGTALRTGRRSSAVIAFSEGNEFRVLANAKLTVTEDVKNKKLKVIKLREGKIEVSLEEDFHETNGLNVETPTAVCGAIGCEFTADSRLQDALYVSAFLCEEGIVRLFGPHFSIPELDEGDLVSIAAALDNMFTRIKTVKGAHETHFRGPDGELRNLPAKAGTITKVWRRKSAGGKVLIVTVLQTKDDGKIDEAFTVKESIETGDDDDDDFGGGDDDDDDDDDDDGGAAGLWDEDDDDDDDWKEGNPSGGVDTDDDDDDDFGGGTGGTGSGRGRATDGDDDDDDGHNVTETGEF